MGITRPENKIIMTFRVMFWLAVLSGLYLSSFYNYLLFHSVAELFSIAIAAGVFFVAWNARRIIQNNYLTLLGIAYLFIGIIDVLHTLSYKGMGVFPGYGANLPTQFWIVARYLEGITLLVAPLFIGRSLKTRTALGAYFVVTALLVLSVFSGYFPDCFIEGQGLTPFKKISEYLISAILVGAIVLLNRKRDAFSHHILRLLQASIVLTIFAELAFTFYVSVYGLSNLVGHFFKILSFYLIYRTLVETGLARPYELLFRDLKQSEQKYQSLFTRMIDGFAFHKIITDEEGRPVDYVFLEVNDAFERLTGLNKDDIIGKRVTEALPGIEKDPADWIGIYGSVALQGKEHRFEQFSAPLDKWYSVSAYSPERGYFAAVFEDITERKRAEQKNVLLSRFAGMLLSAESPERIVENIATEIMDFLDAQAFFNFMADEEKGRLHLNACGGIPEATAKEIEWLDYGVAVCGTVAKTGARMIKVNIQDAPDNLTELVHSFGINAYVCHPLVSKDKVIGTLSFGTRTRPGFREDEIEFLRAVTDQVATAMERKRAEDSLRESEERFRTTLENMIEGCQIIDFDWRYLYTNAVGAMHGRKPAAELKGRTMMDAFPGIENTGMFAALKRCMEDRTTEQLENEFFYPNGDKAWFQLSIQPVPEGIFILSLDITERKKAEEQLKEYAEELTKYSLVLEKNNVELQNLVSEKEMLMKEVHHRVKNNFLIVYSLLRFQSLHVKDIESREMFKESQDRVRAMSLLHEKLYKSHDMENIDFANFIETLAHQLVASYQASTNTVRLKTDVPKLMLDVELMVPCGLIVNELITNALKYAFPEGGSGEIVIAGKLDDNGRFTLSVKDNGVGLPEGFKTGKSGTLGMELVDMLVKQLEGTLEVASQGGAEFRIGFDPQRYSNVSAN